MGKPRRNSKQQVAPWIYNPWLDLIVGCGAWSAPLLLLSYFSLASNARTWSVAFYVLALFFNYPHYMATIYRANHRGEDFEKYRIFTVHITALVVLTLLLSHFWLRLLPWIFTIYLTWSPWHYSGQNYGLFMMFARRAGADPDKAGRRALYGAFIVSYLILFLGFHTGPSSDPLFLSLGIPEVVSRWEQIGLVVAFVGLSAFGLTRLARATGWRKLIPSLTLFSSQFLWFLLPAAISLIKGLEIPQNRYSTGVLAVMHSAQRACCVLKAVAFSLPDPERLASRHRSSNPLHEVRPPARCYSSPRLRTQDWNQYTPSLKRAQQKSAKAC